MTFVLAGFVKYPSLTATDGVGQLNDWTRSAPEERFVTVS